jgi:pimeloyl-ACP methyl ester carboxylesterase
VPRIEELLDVALDVVAEARTFVRRTRAVLDASTDGAPALPEASGAEVRASEPPPAEADARVQAVLNGMWGDRLDRRANGLAVEMSFRHRGRPIPMRRDAWAGAARPPTPRVAVFVHGWSCTESVWWPPEAAPGPSFGDRLREELGYTPLYVRYNTGRHVSENGRSLSALLARLEEVYPVPVEALILVGHSMGGLVARSAAHHGDEANSRWVRALRHVFCLGSPHAGSILEQGAHLFSTLLGAVPTKVTQTWTGILNTRSSGIKDLRFGYTRDDEWRDVDPDAFFLDGRRDAHLVDGVGYHFAAATLTRAPDEPWGRLVGDVFVRPPSASGQTRQVRRRVRFRSGRVLGGLDHFALARHPDAYAIIRSALDPEVPGASRPGRERSSG